MTKYIYSHDVVNAVTGKAIAVGFATKSAAERLVADADGRIVSRHGGHPMYVNYRVKSTRTLNPSYVV